MSKRFRTHGMRAAAVVALPFMAAACGDGEPSQGAQSGVAIAHSTLAAATEPAPEFVSADSPVSTPVTSVTYGDAESVFRKGRYGDAAELFRVYVGEHDASAQGHYMYGLSAWKSGDHDTAERALSRAVELDGESVKMRTNLGRVLLEQGRPQDALPHVEKALELAPESHEVWRVLGNIRSELGQREEALTAYRRALVINDRDAWSMNNYGLVLIEMGRFEEALPPLARAVELAPGSAMFQNNLGVVLERMGRPTDAARAFTAAIEADSTYRKAQISLERVQPLVGPDTREPIDLPAVAQSFVETVQRWGSEGSGHDC